MICELLGMSFAVESAPAEFFQALRKRAEGDSPANDNLDGWGIAWYPDGRAAALIKEDIPASESELAFFIGRCKRIRSRIFIAHVRRASAGIIAYRNTHPFCRELCGREYTFAHNGTWRGFGQVNGGPFRPVGETDSEALFCNILNLIQEIGGLSKKNCSRLLEALRGFNRLTSANLQSKINLLFSDGDVLVAYRDISGKGSLFWLEGEGNCAVVATTKLTSDPGWETLAPGELCAWREEALIYSNTAL